MFLLIFHDYCTVFIVRFIVVSKNFAFPQPSPGLCTAQQSPAESLTARCHAACLRQMTGCLHDGTTHLGPPPREL